eukprot:TRINITY_DN1137_c0_g1_i5.p1 TRINITY_DN1137_c0_g1~~TRINITY_DN1137_c0_g1_i5.p1  ORF type:complete len:545 (-),score=103.82 TRINITY_DN1137_c0_g1_i5:388-2022(-)
MLRSLVGSEMCIRDRYQRRVREWFRGWMSEKRPEPMPSAEEPDAKRRRKSRWQDADEEENGAGGNQLSALQAQIQAQMSNVKQLLAAKKGSTAPAPAAMPNPAMTTSYGAGGIPVQAGQSAAPLRLDARGREVDARGNLVRNNLNDIATLKINTKVVVEKPVKEVLPMMETDPSKNPFYDPSLKLGGRNDRRGGRRQAFVFTEEGSETHKRAADRLRHKLSKKAIAERYGKVQPAAAQIVDGSGDAATEVQPKQEKAVLPFKQEGPIPEVEWWDAVLAPNYVSADKVTFDSSKITMYIQHPIPIEPLCEPKDQGPVPLPLTKKERKKLRTRTRIEAEKEKQAQIRVGLLAPPPPKVKISNMMKALLNEAVQDPSKIEQQVRAAMAQRQRNHELRNEERKLKPEERRQKKLKKIMDETAVEMTVAIYRVEDFSNTQNRYKVDINAAQLHLTGCVILCEETGHSCVVAEGSKSSIKKFGKLLTQRIKWKEEDAAKPGDGCQAIWLGAVKKSTFRNFKLEEFRTEVLARQYLAGKNIAHYWDMCMHK